jgi:hypothetical protein
MATKTDPPTTPDIAPAPAAAPPAKPAAPRPAAGNVLVALTPLAVKRKLTSLTDSSTHLTVRNDLTEVPASSVGADTRHYANTGLVRIITESEG